MGRPLNSRFFGSGAGNQLKVRAKIGTGTEGYGIILKQRSPKRFVVRVGSDVGVCNLVVKANGSLGSNEATISVLTDAGQTKQVSKLYNRTAIVDGAKVKWTFETSSVDGAVEVQEEADSFATLTITAQPVDKTGSIGSSVTINVTASVTPSETISYQWQKQESNSSMWVNLYAFSGNYYTIASLVSNDNGDKYRVIVSSVNGGSIASNAATITVV